MMTGVSPAERMRRQTSQPSILGIITSSSTRLGFWLSKAATAASPSVAMMGW